MTGARITIWLVLSMGVLACTDTESPDSQEPDDATGGSEVGDGDGDTGGGASSSGGDSSLGGSGLGGSSGGADATGGDAPGDTETGGDGSGGDATGGTGTGGDATGGTGTGGDATGGTGTGGDGAGGTTGEPLCSSTGTEIIELVNEYRIANGKPAIPLSPSLCSVASTHVADSIAHPEIFAGDCNLHSWSDAGSWTACCYTPNHAQSQCMWDKPSELTTYTGYGYENSASGATTAAQALEIWKASPGHNDVMLSQGVWASLSWGAIGAHLEGGYASIWFGESADPALD